MVRSNNRLTELRCKRASKPGLHADGGNLYLQITKSASGGVNKSWIFRYGAPSRYLGLGPYPTVSLAEARKKASHARNQLAHSIDPLDHRKAQRRAKALEAAKAMTFGQCADNYIAAHAKGWGADNIKQWRQSLRDHVLPTLGSLPVQ